MEYPKNINHAIEKLQGKWKTQDHVTFEIKDEEIINIEGVITFGDIPLQSAEYSIEFLYPYWTLTNMHLFGCKSNIIQWDENSFTISKKLLTVNGEPYLEGGEAVFTRIFQ